MDMKPIRRILFCGVRLQKDRHTIVLDEYVKNKEFLVEPNALEEFRETKTKKSEQPISHLIQTVNLPNTLPLHQPAQL
jgi:hypothetical protein